MLQRLSWILFSSLTSISGSWQIRYVCDIGSLIGSSQLIFS